MTHAKFQDIPIRDNAEPLVDLQDYPFVLEAAYYDLGYSKSPTIKARQGIADKLVKVQESFDGTYKLKIWDIHRPREVQNNIYQSFYKRLASEHPGWNDEQLHHATEQFVTLATNPDRIPPHATGAAVDLTMVDANGKELDMGTEFDFFGPEAEPMYYEHDDSKTAVHHNRILLRQAMLAQGFTPDADEWWHFDWGNQVWALRANETEAIYAEAE